MAGVRKVPVKSPAESPGPIPTPLQKWLDDREATSARPSVALIPGGKKTREFVLVTVPLRNLEFKNNDYNPREPNEGKVNELAASISTLSLLSPLTCAYIDDAAAATAAELSQEGQADRKPIPRDSKSESEKKDEDESDGEPVVLIDGRHRYNALRLLANEDKPWAESVLVDLKIYFDLPLSDVYLLATYLNRTRKSLAKGEYYKFIVEFWESKVNEWKREHRKDPREIDIWPTVESRDLTDRNADLSVGRIVGTVAFDPEDKGWYPMVGVRQADKLPDGTPGYCPLTAGNLATLLEYLCYTGPYDDDGTERASELTNAIRLGRRFRRAILQPVEDFDVATSSSVGCKHWCLSALGFLMKRWTAALIDGAPDGHKSFLAHPKLRWGRIEELLEIYLQALVPQAELINRYRKLKDSEPEDALDLLKGAWAYQTQRDQILSGLRPVLTGRLKWVPKDANT
jgi:hypothetical protein